MTRYAFVVVMLASFLVTVASAAQEDAGNPPGEALNAVIMGVQGMVQVRESDDKPWQPAKQGMTLGEGAEFRTGPRSAVQFMIPPDQTITLDRLGTVKVLQAVREADHVKTDIGMKYGRTRYDIQKGGNLTHESTVRSPTATLSIRGTRVGVQDGPLFGFSAWSSQDRARLYDRLSRTAVTVGQNTAVDQGSGTPGETQLKQGVVDAGDPNGRVGPEQGLIRDNPGRDFANRGPGEGPPGGREMFNPDRTFGPNIGNSPPPPGIGLLQFDLIWYTPGFNTDLDMFVISPSINDPPLAPFTGATEGAVQQVPSGGFVVGSDDTNGSDGGLETVRWPHGYPVGTYQVGVNGFSLGGLTQVDFSIVVTNGTSESDQTSATFFGSVTETNRKADLFINVPIPPDE